MPSFSFIARNDVGERINGTLDAADGAALADTLAERGLMLVRADAAVAANAPATSTWRGRLFGGDVSAIDLILFCRQLSTLLKAGVPLLRALASLEESATNVRFARVLAEMRSALESGRSLSVAMTDHPNVFNDYMLNTVRVGETTGRLAEAFSGLHDQLSFERSNSDAVRAALRYPITVLVVIAVALTVVNIFVIPSFAKAYRGFKAELPLLTRVLVAVSDFFVSYWPLLAIGLFGGVTALTLWSRTPGGRRIRDRCLLALPVIGPLLHKAALARFTNSFSVALDAGVPMMSALDAAISTTGNVVLSDRINAIKDGTQRGDSLVRSARATGAFTPVVLQMIAVGEETGALAEMMDEVAGHYAREVDYAIKTIGAQIEPLLIVVLGGFVLVFALGVFLPMWDLGKVAVR